MSVKYLLPCKCGLDTPVTTAQAGAEVTCQCGQVLSVPTFLELKRLKPAPQDAPAKPKRAWTPLQGGMFAGGVLVALIAILASIYLSILRSKLVTTKPKVPETSVFIAEAHQQNADELWKRWWVLSDLEKYPLQRRVPRYIGDRRTDGVLRSLLAAAIGIAGAGAAVSVASFFVRVSPKRRRRRRRPPPGGSTKAAG